MTIAYRPSNGTEGELFMERFCYRCKHDDKYQRTQDPEDGCPIIPGTLIYEIDDPKYPTEWVQDDDGANARCTAFVPMEVTP